MATLKSVEEFISNRNIAVIGASANKKKFGYIVFAALCEKGINSIPVNPGQTEINGVKCIKDIADLPENVEAAVFITKPEITEKITKQICESGTIKHIWFQQGAESKAAVDMATKAGKNVVYNACILMHVKPDGFPHNIHKFFMKLFGAFPH